MNDATSCRRLKHVKETAGAWRTRALQVPGPTTMPVAPEIDSDEDTGRPPASTRVRKASHTGRPPASTRESDFGGGGRPRARPAGDPPGRPGRRRRTRPPVRPLPGPALGSIPGPAPGRRAGGRLNLNLKSELSSRRSVRGFAGTRTGPDSDVRVASVRVRRWSNPSLLQVGRGSARQRDSECHASGVHHGQRGRDFRVTSDEQEEGGPVRVRRRSESTSESGRKPERGERERESGSTSVWNLKWMPRSLRGARDPSPERDPGSES
jgi:hypothetical protein